MNDEKRQGSWLKVFCPEARCLTEEEVARLPEDTKKAAARQGGQGLWLEVFCPDESCATGAQEFWGPRKGRDQKGGSGFWMEMFCPDDSCVVTEPTDEP
jgi:hypothetical protein